MIAFLYVVFVFSLILYSLFTQKVEKRTWVFSVTSTMIGVYMLFNYVFFTWIVIKIFYLDEVNNTSTKNSIQLNQDILYVRVLIILNILGYGLPCLFKVKSAISNILFCLPHYIYYSPAYVHTLLIYAFCNVDDLSWGTKGLDFE
jgi:chitin synthase